MGSFFPPSPQPPSTSFFMQIQPLSEEEEAHNNNNSSQNLFPSASLTHLQDYHGMASLLGKRSMSLHSGLDKHGFEEMNGVEDEFSDDCSQLGEKKRRLTMNQVRTLEKNFEVGNKLEPERKMQLARVLGLQPRQIAIWFQNRRARWKTKQLERDYDVLKKQFEAVRSENDDLHAHNKKLQEQIMSLNGREMSSEKPTLNLNKETEVSCSYRTENNNSNKNSDIRPPPPPNNEDLINNPSDQNMSFFPTINPHLLQCPKIENRDAADVGSGGDDSFCNNMFCSLDDQAPGFWTSWQEQQTFH